MEGGACQDTERNRPTEVHSRTGNDRGRDLSGHRKKLADQGALTNWRQQREKLVRTQKETNQPRHTHILETKEGGTCQDSAINQPMEAYPHSGDGRGRDLSGQEKKPTDRGTLTNWRQEREMSGHGKKPTNRGALTPWRQQREGLVRTRKEPD